MDLPEPLRPGVAEGGIVLSIIITASGSGDGVMW
jgi:hypothetical protein